MRPLSRQLTCRLADLVRTLEQGRAPMYLGIDPGTSAVKAVLVDDEQRLIANRAIHSLSRHWNG
jgi:activator of 2-hydroxyglutaryl-CoA dehydratase